VLDLQWSSRVARCSWICRGSRSWCLHGLVSDVQLRFDLGELWFTACAWRKCSTIYRSIPTRANGGVMSASVTSMGIASLARDLNGTVVAKCRCSICGFS